MHPAGQLKDFQPSLTMRCGDLLAVLITEACHTMAIETLLQPVTKPEEIMLSFAQNILLFYSLVSKKLCFSFQ